MRIKIQLCRKFEQHLQITVGRKKNSSQLRSLGSFVLINWMCFCKKFPRLKQWKCLLSSDLLRPLTLSLGLISLSSSGVERRESLRLGITAAHCMPHYGKVHCHPCRFRSLWELVILVTHSKERITIHLCL